jgi:2-succinyl-6-hydroxy-2,4-cyclohexadiene-1-carboxylate synthase
MRQLTHFIYHDSLRYAVFEDGPESAPPLVMLHGFGGSHAGFDHLVPELSRHFRIIRPDLAGHGRTVCFDRDEAARCSTARQCAGLHHIIQQLRLPVEKSLIYGYSMGGRLALQYARRYTSINKNQNGKPSHGISGALPAGFIIESGTCGIADLKQRQARRQQDAALARRITRDFEGFLRDWNSKPVFKTSNPPAPELTRKSAQIRAEQRPAGLAASLRGFGTGAMPCICAELGEIGPAVELWSGAEDEKFTHLATEMEKQLRNGRHHIVKKAGHRIHLESPEFVLKRLPEIQDDIQASSCV